MFHCASLCSFEFFCSFGCSYAFYCSSTLTLLTVFSVMILFSTVYASSIFESLFLLQRSLKCLLLLKSIVWPFLLWLLSIGTLTSWFPRLLIAICISNFLYTAKIYWLWTFVLLSQCLLWCLLYQCLFNVTLVSLFSLVDPVVNFNYFVN